MTINIVAVSEEDVAKALRIEEGHFADIKAKAVAPGKLTRTLAAFANADGGELFVGIAEGQPGQSHRWEGFSNAEAANGHIQAFERVFPLGGEHRYEFLSAASESGLVLHIEIDKSASIKKAIGGTIYKRRGAQNLPVVSDADIRNLERTKGISCSRQKLSNTQSNFSRTRKQLSHFLLTLSRQQTQKPGFESSC